MEFLLETHSQPDIHDGLNIDQDLPYTYADNFSRDKIKINNVW